MPFATTIENSILDNFTGKTAWTSPTGNFVGFSSTTPTKAGTNITEPSGGDYARIQIETSEWAAAAAGATSNNADQTYTTASADWLSGVNLTHFVIYDASTAGNYLGFASVTTPRPVLNGDTPKILSGDLDLVFS